MTSESVTYINNLFAGFRKRNVMVSGGTSLKDSILSETATEKILMGSRRATGLLFKRNMDRMEDGRTGVPQSWL